jgi:hypothetical protein
MAKKKTSEKKGNSRKKVLRVFVKKSRKASNKSKNRKVLKIKAFLRKKKLKKRR